MDVRRLEIPAELAALLHFAQDHNPAQSNQVTEVSLPEVKAKATFSLPHDINNFPFSTFVQTHFQVVSFPALGQPLQEPLTQLHTEHRQNALQLNKLVLRFINDWELQGIHEQILGNYIASRGLASPPLRNELLSQIATQLWKNPDLEQCQRGWVLMATLLSAFTPSPALEKPLLKFVSDHGLEGYNGMCQHKLLTSMKQTEGYLELSRSFPPTGLEWTANQRKGKMVLEVCTYKEERISAEVESWTTGEQYAGWILNSRGLDIVPRGWSISMFTGNKWQDLAGCDFVLDLVGGMEEVNCPSQSSSNFPIIPERDVSYFQRNSPNRKSLDIPPAPTFKAPSFPPPPLPPMFDKAVHPDPMDSPTPSRELGHYVDGLFEPLLHAGSRPHMSAMESEANLTGRMKGGGKIGPMNQGVYSGYPGMMTMPTFPTMPVMGGMMPATMPGMPAMMMTHPMMPSMDPNQAAAQQQSVINQQALFLAQQMTLQAMKISEQDQQQKQKHRSPEHSHPNQLPSHRSHEHSMQRQPSPHSSPTLSRPRRATPKRRTSEHLRRRPSSSESSPESLRSTRVSPRKQSPEASRPRRTSPKSRSPSSPKKTLLPKRPPELSRSKKVSVKEQPSESSRPIQESRSPSPPPQSPIHILEEEVTADVRVDSLSRGTFQKKVEFFQRMGIEAAPLKKVSSKSRRVKEKSEDPSANQESNSDLPPPTQLENYQERKFQNTKPEQPEPSQEIRNIIKTHKKRPIPPPKPIMPARDVSKSLTKGEPKEEALAKLEALGLDHPSVSSEKIKSSPPLPPVKPSNTIKEKQLSLRSVFGPEGLVLPPPPPGPPPSFPPDSVTDETTGTKDVDSTKILLEDANVKTQLFNLSASVSFSYANPIWKLFLRKEVFYPRENFSHPYCLNLLCDQILRDTYSESCIRISKEERRKMKDLLTEFHVGMDVSSITEEGIKKRIVVAARDNWASYFSRLFPVKGENGSDVQILGVSHRGLQLLKKSKEATFSSEHLKVLCSFSYADVLSLELISRNVLQFSLKNEQLILHSQKAQQIKATVEVFLKELKQDSNYVIAMRNYVTDDKSLLNFKKSDFIRLLPMKGLEPGWQFGSIGGRSGLFPAGMVQVVAAPDYLNLHMNQQEEVRTVWKKNTQEKMVIEEKSASSTESEVSRTSTPINSVDICHYPMTEFAVAHFREARLMLPWSDMGTEQMALTLLVQHTEVPIQEALLCHSDDALNDLATKNFLTLMRFMGDQPGLKKQDKMDYIYEILQCCKYKKTLHDEVYCQVIKQITGNPNLDSCRHGWQLLSLLTGYFLPSNTLRPYITEFLQQICYDSNHPCSGIAEDCQSNLKKLITYGSRKHLPFLAEMRAFLKGHSLRRISVILPGGLQYSTKIKTFTVTADVLKEICEHIGVTELEEIQEFAILADKDKGKMRRPLHQEEYVQDYLLEESSIGLHFCRITWKIPLHFDNEVYINVHYNQVLQNYMTGKISLQHNTKLGQQLGILALLQHWAKGAPSIPTREELKNYIPVSAPHLSPDIVEIAMAYQMETLEPLQPLQAQVRFIEHIIQLPLFGYNVFSVEKISAPDIPSPCIVGVNQEEIVARSKETQSNQIIIPLKQILRMKSFRPSKAAGLSGIEINYGSMENPKTIWFELQQAKTLYHLITIIGGGSDSQV
ncbi:PREDICTED: unconventional myosin-XVB-like [Thamnophis sirtalis]|uniref:Unconventional myosin-XVB-like n=1 Tax=Thamnophis sirtalis TaxID=35019 RepID=A0A6I9YEI4_9SAUR|nr:PREDICTED: unconventional myosin-XVB-like [Thamnophis sirtalis]